MAEFEIILLAKSTKLGGKCIAGLRTDGGGWIRPVAPTPNGALLQRHFTLSNGTQAEVLDVVKIKVKEPRPKPHQPENWTIEDEAWRLISRPASGSQRSVLVDHIVFGPKLLGNQSDCVHINIFEEKPAEASLALVIPKTIEWSIGTNVKGRRQTRAVFELKSAKYDLVVTDPAWENRLSTLPEGIHPPTNLKTIGLNPNVKFLLTVSLGEPFGRYCYKLVASVLSTD